MDFTIVELEDKREVSYDEGQSLADKYVIKFYEVSSISGQNIDELFYNTTYYIAKKNRFKWWKLWY